MEQGRTDYLFISIPEVVLKDIELSWFEKILFGRIMGLPEYFESKENASQFFGNNIKPDTIRKAKQNLERLGWIKSIGNNGNGKIYIANLEMIRQKSATLNHQKAEEWQKNATQSGKKMPPYNKDENKDNNDSKESLLADSQAEATKEFGNPDINQALEQWAKATGYDFKSNQYERRAISNLLRRKDIKSLGGFIPLLKLVEDARHIDNQFAPKIAKPSELGGKYSKLEKLLDWAKRNQQNQTTPTNRYVRKISEQEQALIGSYFKPIARVEEKPMTAEEEAKWQQVAKANCQRARAIFEKRMAEKKAKGDKR